MAHLKSEAIVLRRFDYSETSQVAWVYTRDFGKERLIAKGAKRLGKNALGALDPLTHIHVVFIDKEHAGLRTLTEWDLLSSFDGLRQNLDRVYLASYAVELVNELTEVGEPNPKVFDLLVRILTRLCVPDDHHKLVFAFEFGLLRAVGFAPEVGRCAHCGIALTQDRRTYFSAGEGCMLCFDCRQSDDAAVAVSYAALGAMAGLARGGREYLDRLRLGRETGAEIRRLLDIHLQRVVGKELKVRRYLNLQFEGAQR